MQHYFIVDKKKELKTKEELKNNDTQKTHKGKFAGIVITASKAHNRFVTSITNLQFLGIDQKKLLDYFRNKFNTSGSVKSNKIKGSELTLQGIFLDQVKEYLEYTVLVPKDLIVVVDKVSSKKKKETFK